MTTAKTLRLVLVLMALSLSSACTSWPSLYYWGSHEQQISSIYAADSATPAQTIELMERDYQTMRSNRTTAPPGFHAQLGYLYRQVGKVDAAENAFRLEKAMFPESAVLMDRLIANMNRAPKK